MPLSTAPTKPAAPWFQIGLLGLLLFSLALRFWGLGRFNTLVFDEVYYAKFAHNYLSQTPFFDGHPPLSKYIIAIGMWLGEQMPFGQAEKNGLAGGLYAPWTYRWVNAFTGSFIPLVIAGLAYQLTRQRSFAWLAGLFAALDGLFLVESRYALNNVYLVIFGLLGWWGLLQALEQARSRRVLWLTLAGIGFGASASIKWNGLWFLLGAYGLWVCAQIVNQFQYLFVASAPRPDATPDKRPDRPPSPLQQMHQLRWWQVGLFLGLVPFLTYFVEWIPHLQLNAKHGLWSDFWALQGEILSYHNRVGSGSDVHPYCSSWYSWLVMWRPVAYFYQITGKNDPLPTEQTLPPTSAERVVYDVHAMGNPFLWWFSTLAIAIALWLLVSLILRYLVDLIRYHRWPLRPFHIAPFKLGLSPNEQWLVLFLGVNYLANLLPWVRVTRCIFLYHYMGALVFASMSLAWIVDRWLHSRQAFLRQMGLAVVIIGAIAFVFWLPIYLGLPLSLNGYCVSGTSQCINAFQLRMWLRSWI